jgi:hypothetical protein
VRHWPQTVPHNPCRGSARRCEDKAESFGIALRPVTFQLGHSNLHGNADIPAFFHAWLGVLDNTLSNKGVHFRMPHPHGQSASTETAATVKGGENRPANESCHAMVQWRDGV